MNADTQQATHTIELTPEQWNAITVVDRHTRRWGVPPKVQDVQQQCGIATRQDTHAVLRELEDLRLVKLKFAQRAGHGGAVWRAMLTSPAPGRVTIGYAP